MQVQNQVARTLRANLSRLREVLDSTAARGIKSIGRAPFFGAYERPGVNGVKMATPEKALLDLLYLSSTKTRLSAALPELDLSAGFSIRNAERLLLRIPSSRRRSMVERNLRDVTMSRDG